MDFQSSDIYLPTRRVLWECGSIFHEKHEFEVPLLVSPPGLAGERNVCIILLIKYENAFSDHIYQRCHSKHSLEQIFTNIDSYFVAIGSI